jgi:hypothetical protein
MKNNPISLNIVLLHNFKYSLSEHLNAGKNMMHKKNIFVAINVLVIAVLLFSAVLPISVYAKKPGAATIIDNFSFKKLSSDWTLVDPIGDSTFDLAVNRGWLRITCPPYRDLCGPNTDAPRIVRTSISSDFVVETKVLATTDQCDEGAGILVWKDANTYLRLERISRTLSPPVYQEILFTAGGSNYLIVYVDTTLNPTYLKLVRSNNQYTGYYSSDGTTWLSTETLTTTLSGSIDVGLDVVNMYHSDTFYADFDYFKLTYT